jgi:hypothetical protein
MCASLTSAVLFALLACASAALQVENAEQLKNALVNSEVSSIKLVSTIRVTKQNWPSAVRISRTVALHGAPGAVLDLHGACEGLLEVAAPGRVVLSSLTLAVCSLPSSGVGSGPVPSFLSTGGSISYDHVIFYASGPAVQQQQASNSSSTLRTHQPSATEQHAQLGSSSNAWRLKDWGSGLQEVISCSAVADGDSCFAGSSKPGSVSAYDSVSLRDAVADPAVHSIVVLQDIQLQSQDCSSSSSKGEQLVISRPLSLSSCAGAVLRFNSLQSCWLVASGGLLQLQRGVRLSHATGPQQSLSSSSNVRSLLLPAVDVASSGAVVLQGVEVQLLSAPATAAAWQTCLHRSQQQQGLKLHKVADDTVLVQDWRLVSMPGVQQRLAHSIKAAHAVLSPAAAPSAAQHVLAASRRLLVQESAVRHAFNMMQQQQQQQQLAGLQEPAASRQRQLLHNPFAEGSASNRSTPATSTSDDHSSHWITGDLEALGAAYPRGRCFTDFPGFLASDIVTFVRLIKDPAITRIELTGDIKFTEELFPPANANNQSLGINITHTVNRAL